MDSYIRTANDLPKKLGYKITTKEYGIIKIIFSNTNNNKRISFDFSNENAKLEFMGIAMENDLPIETIHCWNTFDVFASVELLDYEKLANTLKFLEENFCLFTPQQKEYI